MHDFDEIRPYRDAEVADVLARIIGDKEFLDLILERQFSWLPAYFLPLIRPVLRWHLKRLSHDLETVRDFQAHLSSRLKAILDETTTSYGFSGIENLQRDQAYVFMSNHRDIALDPALVILGLVESGRDSLRIAIGDNLLTKPFASDLMRINRSFIVKRSLSGRREKFAALKLLSCYIRHSISTDAVSIWIAQAEGRAKDGRDRTETALLKMLALSRCGEQSFGEAMRTLNIVPVSIAYEYDPCDGDKAAELFVGQQGDIYRKTAYEDLATIKKGFEGFKGRVHVNFGEPLVTEFETADHLASAIDRHIVSGYRLFPSHIVAWQWLNPDDDASVLHALWPDEDWIRAHANLQRRLDQLPEEHRDIVLAGYAAPVIDQLAFAQRPQGAI